MYKESLEEDRRRDLSISKDCDIEFVVMGEHDVVVEGDKRHLVVVTLIILIEMILEIVNCLTLDEIYSLEYLYLKMIWYLYKENNHY